MDKKSENKELKNFRQYTEVTYAGRKLLEKYSLDTVGVWRIKGEDPNCDFGGYHYQPELGIVSGKLRDVIMYGVNLPNFWNWGAGGDFELIGKEIPTIDSKSLEVRKQLEAEAKELEERLAEVKRQLGKK